MRIALITDVRSRIGGTESYIEQVAAELDAAGHAVALWHEHEGPDGRGRIELPDRSASWSAESLGMAAALDGLRRWRPDVLFSHGLGRPEVEEEILRVGPTVMFAHAYHGACISGTKSRLSPRRMPCSRPLGVPCLIHYLPRRCGGWSPVTMVSRYALQTRRRDMLGRYAAILTASTHMHDEYLKYGLPPDHVQVVGLMVPQPAAAGEPLPPAAAHALATEWRLLFVARLTALKGGSLLLDALPLLRRSYDGRIVLTVAGDGPERPRLERDASRILAALPNVDVRFAGWLAQDELTRTMRSTDLLVLPSIWPEPFGLVGPEAGLHAVPSAGFAVGGIPDWLRDGITGHLAPGTPPTARGLAEAIVKCLRDPQHHRDLRAGALAGARRLGAAQHMPLLLAILERAAGSAASGRGLS